MCDEKAVVLATNVWQYEKLACTDISSYNESLLAVLLIGAVMHRLLLIKNLQKIWKQNYFTE